MDIRIEKVEKDWFVGSFQRTIDEQQARIAALEKKIAELKGHLQKMLDEVNPPHDPIEYFDNSAGANICMFCGRAAEDHDKTCIKEKYLAARRACEE